MKIMSEGNTVENVDIISPILIGCNELTHWGRDKMAAIFQWIFFHENVWISINISLKFVPRGPINNTSTLVQVMAWRRPGAKPLSEPMMVRLPTHICVTRPQWVKTPRPARHESHIVCQPVNTDPAGGTINAASSMDSVTNSNAGTPYYYQIALLEVSAMTPQDVTMRGVMVDNASHERLIYVPTNYGNLLSRSNR